MKTLFPFCFLLLWGCAAKSEFDISDAQAKKRRVGPPGLRGKLPPGAKKTERKFKKGDVLPDGTIADGDRKMVTIEMGGPAPGGGQIRQRDVMVGP